MVIVYIRQSTEVLHTRKAGLMALVQDDFSALLSEAMHFSGRQPLLKCNCLGCGACSLKKNSARWLSKIRFTLYTASLLYNSRVPQSDCCKGAHLGGVRNRSALLNMQWVCAQEATLSIAIGTCPPTVQVLPFTFCFCLCQNVSAK